MIIIGYVAGHLRYKFNKKKRIDHSLDDNCDVDNDNRNSKEEEESTWYDCLATAPHGGIAISGAWTSDNVFLEVTIQSLKKAFKK